MRNLDLIVVCGMLLMTALNTKADTALNTTTSTTATTTATSASTNTTNASTTTKAPDTTTAHITTKAPDTTTHSNASTTTQPPPKPCGFDGGSFVGGMVLGLFIPIALYFLSRYCKRRKQRVALHLAVASRGEEGEI